MKLKASRLKWIVAGAIVGGLLGLWQYATVDSRPTQLTLAIVFGGYLGSSFSTKTPRERRSFIGLFLGIVVIHRLWFLILDPMSLPTSDCCGSGTSDKFATSLATLVLTICTLLGGTILWEKLTKKVQRPESTADRIALLKERRAKVG